MLAVAFKIRFRSFRLFWPDFIHNWLGDLQFNCIFVFFMYILDAYFATVKFCTGKIFPYVNQNVASRRRYMGREKLLQVAEHGPERRRRMRSKLPSASAYGAVPWELGLAPSDALGEYSVCGTPKRTLLHLTEDWERDVVDDETLPEGKTRLEKSRQFRFVYASIVQICYEYTKTSDQFDA